MRYFNTGNDIVDQVGEMNIVGDIVPREWLYTVCDTNGKPNLLAMLVLAHIVYMYRPRQIRDEMSGALIGWEKRFAEDYLQSNYADLAKTFNQQNKKSMQRALRMLEELGVIQRHFRTVPREKKSDLQNVMYIELKPERLRELTFPVKKDDEEDDYQQMLNERYLSGRVKVLRSGTESVFDNDDFVHRCGHNCPNETTEKSELSIENKKNNGKKAENSTDFKHGSGHQCPRGMSDLSIPSEFVHTNTERSINIHIGSHNNPSIYPSKDRVIDRDKEAEACIALLRENIEYDQHMQSDDWVDRDLYRDMFNIMANTLRSQSEKVRVGRDIFSYETVKRRLLQINEEHMIYVIDCMKRNTNRVANIKQYLLTSLFNSVDTLDSYYMKQVQEDMPWLYDPAWKRSSTDVQSVEEA